MDYAKPISPVKFYFSVIGGTLLIVLGFKATEKGMSLEQAGSAVTLALSIILQALPFILIGVLISSLIRLLVREEWIARFAPRGGLAGVIAGGLLGLFFPVCDCGVLPVARSLLRKGVSMQTAFAYLLTAPVINPLVILATALAFQWNWHFVILRILGTFLVGTVTAFLVGNFFTPRDFKLAAAEEHKGESHTPVQTIHELFLHAAEEFFDIGGYLIVSAFLAAAIQVGVPKEILFQFVNNPFLAVLAMMILAIAMSLCSEADAFVARVLANQFPLGSVFAFLLIGQILDLRNIILFSKNFRISLFVLIAVSSVLLTFLWGLSIDLILRLRIM